MKTDRPIQPERLPHQSPGQRPGKRPPQPFRLKACNKFHPVSTPTNQNILYIAAGKRSLNYKPATWQWSPAKTYDNLMFDRGYTGHEHLVEFGLINMNGRVGVYPAILREPIGKPFPQSGSGYLSRFFAGSSPHGTPKATTDMPMCLTIRCVLLTLRD
jgi:hypothetical protein